MVIWIIFQVPQIGSKLWTWFHKSGFKMQLDQKDHNNVATMWPAENSRHATHQVKSCSITFFLRALQEYFAIILSDLLWPQLGIISKYDKRIVHMVLMQNMLVNNSNASHSKQVVHVLMKLYDEFDNMIWEVDEQEQTNSLWFSPMVHRKIHREQPVKQGHSKIQVFRVK